MKSIQFKFLNRNESFFRSTLTDGSFGLSLENDLGGLNFRASDVKRIRKLERNFDATVESLLVSAIHSLFLFSHFLSHFLSLYFAIFVTWLHPEKITTTLSLPSYFNSFSLLHALILALTPAHTHSPTHTRTHTYSHSHPHLHALTHWEIMLLSLTQA